MTEIGQALMPFAKAARVAEELRRAAPDHELLRLVACGNDPHTQDRLDQERIDRFLKVERGVEADKLPQSRVDEITFTALTEAMSKAMQDHGRLALKIDITRVKVHLDPPTYIFNVMIDCLHPAGVWTHTAPSEEHLNAFLGGIRAVTRCMGFYVPIPDLPGEYGAQEAFLKEEAVPVEEDELDEIPI